MKKFTFIIIVMLLAGKVNAQPWCHDPSTVVFNNGRFWTYSTGHGIAVHSSISKEFTSFRNDPPVFPVGTFPDWIKTYVPEFDGHFWAPDIFYMNGKWHLYYSCSSWGSRNSAIGLVTTNSLSQPTWQDQGMVTFTTNSMNHNAIDPAIFRDYDGKIWMLYGSYWNGLAVTEIDSLTGKPFNRNNITFVANNNCEAGSVTKENGYYYLFFNRGTCCSGIHSTYNILVGRSASPTGPFLDKNGVNCNQGGGTSFLRSDGRFVGPGHFSRIDSIFSYHIYDAQFNGASRMKTAKLRWVDGWPVAEYVSQGAIKDGIYSIRNRHSQKVIGLSNAQTSDGTAVVLDSDVNRHSNLWRFTYTDEKFYRITPYLAQDKMLEIRACGTRNGDKAIVWTDVGSACQEWYISMLDQGYYRIANKNSHLMLEIINAFTHDGAEAQQWPYNEHFTQHWIMTEHVPTALESSFENKILIQVDVNSRQLTINSEYPVDGHHLMIYCSSGKLITSNKLQSTISDIRFPDALQQGGLFLFRIIDSSGNVIASEKKIL